MVMENKKKKHKTTKVAKSKKSTADSNIDPRTGKPKSKFTLYWEKMGDDYKIEYDLKAVMR